MQRRLGGAGGTGRIGAVGKGIAGQRLVGRRFGLVGFRPQLPRIHDAGPRKPVAQSISGHHKCRLRVLLLECMVVGAQARIRNERHNPPSQTGQQ